MWDIKALQSDLELMKRGTLDKLRLETTVTIQSEILIIANTIYVQALEKESQNLLKIFKVRNSHWPFKDAKILP